MFCTSRRSTSSENKTEESFNEISRRISATLPINPLHAELNPICHLLTLLGAHHIFHVSGLRVKAYWLRDAPTCLTFHNCTLCPHCTTGIYVFCIYLRTNSDLCHLQHKLIGFYNPDEKCLQRGTDWVFK